MSKRNNKKTKLNLERRQADWDRLGTEDKTATKRPGSRNRNKGQSEAGRAHRKHR